MPPIWLHRARLAVKKTASDHQELLILLAIFLSLRSSLLVISAPQGYLLGISDYDFYLEYGQLSDRGLYPMLSYWTEYPPVFPWLAVGAYKATMAIPNLNGSPIFWFRLTLGGLLLLFDTGNLILIYWLARTLHSGPRAIQCAWTYALLFTPLHVWLAWFDTVPLFFLLLAVVLIVRGKLGAAAMASGFGFMVKVFPILALPALLKIEPSNRKRALLVAQCALVAALVAAPFLITAPEYLLASFKSMVYRSPWETPWALAEDYFGYGQVPPLEERRDPSTASDAAYPSHLPWTAISAAFALLYLFVWTRRCKSHTAHTTVAFTGLTVNLFLLYSKGYSPQFLLYVVPFAILVLPPFRAISHLITLGAINLLEYPVYGVLFDDQHWVLRDLVILRTLLLALMAWDYLAALQLCSPMATLRKAASGAALLAFGLWLVIALPQAGSRWAASTMEKHADAQLIRYLQANADSQSIVLFTEQWLYRELYPFLYRHTNLALVDLTGESMPVPGIAGSSEANGGTDVSAQLASLFGRYTEVYTVHRILDRDGARLEQLLEQHARIQVVRRANDVKLSSWTPR